MLECPTRTHGLRFLFQCFYYLSLFYSPCESLVSKDLYLICFVVNAQKQFDKVTKINKTYLILDIHLEIYSGSTMVMHLFIVIFVYMYYYVLLYYI